jgi:drug/metabolite transporter (DMT)-like permease
MFESTDEHAHLWPGVPLALASAVLFGATPPLSKLLLGEMSPFLLAGLLYLGAGVGLAAVEVARRLIARAPSEETAISRTDLPWLAAAIFAGGVVAPVLLMSGLTRTTASSGALLLNLEGLATMAIAWIVFRENVDRRLLVGAAAILAGAVALSWTGEGPSSDLGGLLIAGACLAWGIDNNLTRKVSAADPVPITIWKGMIAGSVNIVVAAMNGATLPGSLPTAFAAVVGFLGVGISLVLFICALRHLGSARTGAYFSLAPFIGAAMAVILLGEAVTVRLGVAALLMAFGLWLHLNERHEHEHGHDEIEHDHLHEHDEHHGHAHAEPVTGAHGHPHRHAPLIHAHVHYPDLHHRHGH